MKNKFFYLAITAVVAVTAVTALAARFSYLPDGSGVLNYKYNFNTVYAKDLLSGSLWETSASSAADLYKQADVVAACKFTGNRYISTDAFYSTVSVDRIYKGSGSLKGHDILVIEYALTSVRNHSVVMSTGQTPLKKGEEYILLLTKKKTSGYRAAGDIMSSEYSVLTNSPFGKYRVSEMQQKPVIGKPAVLKDLNNYDYATDDLSSIKLYDRFRNSLFEKLGIQP